MPFTHAGRDTEVFVSPSLGDGHVGFEIPVGIQHGTQGYFTHICGDVLAGHGVQPRLCTRTADAGFSKTRQIHQPHMVHHVPAFISHMGKRVVAAPAWVLPFVCFFLGKVIGALPPVIVAEYGPGLFLIRVDGAGAIGTGSIPPVIGADDRIKPWIGIFDLFMIVSPVDRGTVAPAVNRPEVDLRLALHDPAGQIVADTPCLGDAETVTTGMKEVF